MTAQPAAAPKDNLFGVCHAIGEDLGFNPLYLRLTLAALLLWDPVVVIAAYATLGIVVLATRLMFPGKPRAAAIPLEEEVEEPITYAKAA